MEITLPNVPYNQKSAGKGRGNGDGSGYGNGSGYGYGSGSGYGYGNGGGNGNGSGYGNGSGNGNGRGNGNGNGSGYGNGSGNGNGRGTGGGFGYGNENTCVYVDKKTPIIAYHYVNNDLTLGFRHGGKKITVKKGMVLETFRIKECMEGLHASLTPEWARRYRRGVLTRVACSGWVIFSEDKLVCSRREVLDIFYNGSFL